MNISQAIATAATAGDAKVRRAYAAAIAHGASNTLCTAEQERAYGTLRLLTLVWLRLPDLVLYSHLLEGFADDPEVDRVAPVVVNAVRGVAAGALRLAHRALRPTAATVGYQTGSWIDRALEHAGVELTRNAGESNSRRCRSCWTSRGWRRSRWRGRRRRRLVIGCASRRRSRTACRICWPST
jgi:hypothetical protein